MAKIYVVTVDVPNPPWPSDVKVIHVGTDRNKFLDAFADAVVRKCLNVQEFCLGGERLV